MTLVAPRIVNDVSYVSRINHECYFVVQSSTGLVLCSTELYFVVQSSTGLVLCRTGVCFVVQSSTGSTL